MSAFERLYRNETEVDFVRWWKRGAVVSAVLVLVFGIGLAVRGLNLGIEFEGGVVWEVDAPGVGVEDARDALRSLGQADASIQIVGDETLQVRAELAQDAAEVIAVTDVLAELAGTAPNDVSFSDVSPSWGDEVTDKARTALIVFFIVIALYITLRLEWRMAVAALVAVAHDILLTVGFYALFQIEVSPATVIAFLTILGYSLYDTMIVFDKIRENEARPATAAKLTYTELTSLSLNQVLARSLNTTVTSVMPVASVLFIGSFAMGAVALQDFGIALLVGMISGTYSSLFVAAPVVALLKEREPANIERRERLEARSVSRGEAMHEARGPDEGPVRPARSPARPTTRAPVRPAAGGIIPPRPRKQKRRR